MHVCVPQEVPAREDAAQEADAAGHDAAPQAVADPQPGQPLPLQGTEDGSGGQQPHDSHAGSEHFCFILLWRGATAQEVERLTRAGVEPSPCLRHYFPGVNLSSDLTSPKWIGATVAQ